MKRTISGQSALRGVCWRCQCVQASTTPRSFFSTTRTLNEEDSTSRLDRARKSFSQISNLPRGNSRPPQAYVSVGDADDPSPADRARFISGRDRGRGSFMRGRGFGGGMRGGRGGRGGRGDARGGRGGRGGRADVAGGRSRGQASGDRDNNKELTLDDYPELEDITPTNTDLLLEEDEGEFTDMIELQHYGQVMDFMDQYRDHMEVSDRLRKEQDKVIKRQRKELSVGEWMHILPGDVEFDQEIIEPEDSEREVEEELDARIKEDEEFLAAVRRGEKKPSDEIRPTGDFQQQKDANGEAVPKDFVRPGAFIATAHEKAFRSLSENDVLTPEEVQRRMAAVREINYKHWDSQIRDAMQHMIETDAHALPVHFPQESPSTSAPLGLLGDIPTGDAGMSNVVEGDLRYVARRQTHEWQAPKELAERLVRGDLVKFRDIAEKKEVLKLAEMMTYRPDRGEFEEDVGFKPPEAEARQALLQRLVAGRHEDVSDANVKGRYAKGVSRLLNGNTSYTSEHKDMLLNTIRELLPEGQGPARRQARR